MQTTRAIQFTITVDTTFIGLATGFARDIKHLLLVLVGFYAANPID